MSVTWFDIGPCVISVSQTLSRLSCALKRANQTRVVVCDLGNPMKGGTKVTAGFPH